MSSLSKAIGDGVQTFRIRDFDQHFSLVEDLGPDKKNFLMSRKIVKLVDEDLLYLLVEVPHKDVDEFVVRLTEDISKINWRELARSTAKYQWRGPDLDPRYIN